MDNRQAPVAQGNPGKVLTFGILGLAFCETGILGLIFSIIGLTKAKNYIATYGPVSGQVRTGKILSTIGLILSIVMIVFWVAFTIIMVNVVSNASQSQLQELSDYLKNYSY